MQNIPIRHEVVTLMDNLFTRAQRLAHENAYLRMVRDAAQDVLKDPNSALALKALAYALALDVLNARADGGAE